MLGWFPPHPWTVRRFGGIAVPVEVILTRVGKAPEDFTRFVLDVLRGFYSSPPADQDGPAFVEVVLYGLGRSPLDLLSDEAAELGVWVLGHYPVSHEAWRGWPRIHVDYEKCSKLEPELLRALLVHEAAHSMIHGGREYYEVPRGLLTSVMSVAPLGIEALYLASTVVKDLEVHRYLVERGYRGLVETYARYSIRESAGSSCSSLLDALNLAKMVSPCVYVGCPELAGSLGEGCARAMGDLLGALAELERSTSGWADRAVELVRRVAELLSDG